MNKRIVRILTTAASLILTLCLFITVPCATASAAQQQAETETQSQRDIQVKEEGLGDLIGGLGGLLGSDVIGDLFKVDWTVFFNKDYDWESLFSGDMSFREMQETKEWDVLVDMAMDLIGSTLTEQEMEALAETAEVNFLGISAQSLLEKLGKALKGDYNQYFDILNGDYSGLLQLSDSSLTSLFTALLKDGDSSVSEYFGGDYSMLIDLLGGDYSCMMGLLNGDYSWISELISKEDVNLEELFDALDDETIKELLEDAVGDDEKILAFVDEYYDQIAALTKEDYSFITEIKDGKYEDMLKLVQKLSELVGFEYSDSLTDVIGQLASLNDSEVSSIVRTLEIMLYDALPEEYRNIMTGAQEIKEKLDDIASDVDGLIDVIIGLIGDVDMDDLVSMTDVVLVQRNIADITRLSTEQKSHADVDRDGNVTMSDVVMMQRMAAGLVTA